VPVIPSIVYEIDGRESNGPGLAAGASQSRTRKANGGRKSRPTRRSLDLFLEITDLLHGRGATRSESYSLVTCVTILPFQAPGTMNVEWPSSL
jgi:hypothetical protein